MHVDGNESMGLSNKCIHFQVLREVALSGWRYFNNASPSLKIALDEAENVLSLFVRSTSMQAKQFDMASVTDDKLKRQLGYVSFEGMSALAPSRFAEFSQAQAAVITVIMRYNCKATFSVES